MSDYAVVIEPPAGPLPRADLVQMLRTARKLIATITTPVGGMFRKGFLSDIDDAIAREDRAAALPDTTCIVVMGRRIQRMERRDGFAVLDMGSATAIFDAEAVRRAAVILGIRLARDEQ